jgi:hypothetical protein
MVRNSMAYAIGLTMMLLPLPASACNENLPTAVIAVKEIPLMVELAATPAARACGLSHRKHLPENQGMLFVHPRPQMLSYWMKDTSIPLSIAFIGNAGRILAIHKMMPMQIDKRYRPPQPVRYALEVNQGWFDKHGIQVGDAVELQLPLVLDIR